MALSIQRWVQPNPRVTSPHYNILEQARLCTLFAAGSEGFNFILLVDVLHALVHCAFVLFYAGLWIYISILAVEMMVVAWVIISSLVYISLTVLPVLRPGFPCSTPFTPIFAIVYGYILQGVSRLLYSVRSLIRVCRTTEETSSPEDRFLGWSLWTFEEVRAQKLAPKFDGELLKRTLDMLNSDDDLEQFFDAIPGFCTSKIVDDPRRSLDILGQQRLAEAIVGFWNRTLSSNLLSESDKGRRLIVCMGAIEAANLAVAAPGTLRDLSYRYLGGISRSAEVGHSLGNLRHGNVASLARGIIAAIISNAERNDRWFTLAVDELDISRDVLRGYLANGDSVLLANLIHTTRHFSHNLLQPHPDLTREALSILPSLSKFDVLSTLPELQHDFCAMWNEVVQRARDGPENNPFVDILITIQGLYIALHGSEATLSNAPAINHGVLLRQPTSYSFCTMTHHHT